MDELLNALISGSVLLDKRLSARGVPRLGKVLRRLAVERPVKAANRANAGVFRVMSWWWSIPAWTFLAMGSPMARNNMVGRAKAFASASRKT